MSWASVPFGLQKERESPPAFWFSSLSESVDEQTTFFLFFGRSLRAMLFASILGVHWYDTSRFTIILNVL